MMNKNVKMMLLFVALCILFVGIVSAQSVDSNDSTIQADTISDQTTDTDESVSQTDDNAADDNSKDLNKNVMDNPVKTATTNEPAYTYIKLNTIKDTTLGKNVNINGYYYYGNDIPLTYTPMRIKINGQTTLAKTDNKGYFTYDYKTTKSGENLAVVYYPGNARFSEASTSVSFNVKSTGPQYTYITLNNVKDVAYGASTTISGYYYYGDKIPLTYTNMRVNINGVQVLSKTDAKGFFTYTYKTNRVGKNTVKVSYPGNNNFKAASATKTFNVKITSPISTYITLDSIKPVTVGETMAVSGHYYYSDNIPLTYTPMRINLNGQTYTAKTDGNGYFTYNYKTTRNGTGTVTVSYPGNTNFKSATVTKTFYVKSVGPQYTYIVMDNIPDISYDDAISISGHYYYGNDIPLTYTPMRITINGMLYETVKTDDKGYFTYYHIPEKVFKNTVNVSYNGNRNFMAASATKTFNVKITSPIDTYVDLFEVEGVDVGDITTINGYYSYGYGEPLTYTTMTININGKNYYAKTDFEGYFYFDYEPTKAGTNKVTVSYAGNSNFKAASTSTTFNVGDKYKVVTMTITRGKSTSVVIDGDPFAFHYSTTDAQYAKGVYVEIDDRGLEWPPVNKLDKAVIYFKNSNNNIITRTVKPQSVTHIETPLITGYTPFKAEVTYCKMTDDERDEYWFSQI